jgi:hypothetical protein
MVIAMPNQELKLKQASAVLDVRPKDLQNLVQSGVLRPRRVGSLYYFDRKALVSAKVALYLKGSLGASTRYLTQFTRAVSKVPGFATGEAEAARGGASTKAIRLSSPRWRNMLRRRCGGTHGEGRSRSTSRHRTRARAPGRRCARSTCP